MNDFWLRADTPNHYVESLTQANERIRLRESLQLAIKMLIKQSFEADVIIDPTPFFAAFEETLSYGFIDKGVRKVWNYIEWLLLANPSLPNPIKARNIDIKIPEVKLRYLLAEDLNNQYLATRFQTLFSNVDLTRGWYETHACVVVHEEVSFLSSLLSSLNAIKFNIYLNLQQLEEEHSQTNIISSIEASDPKKVLRKKISKKSCCNRRSWCTKKYINIHC